MKIGFSNYAVTLSEEDYKTVTDVLNKYVTEDNEVFEIDTIVKGWWSRIQILNNLPRRS